MPSPITLLNPNSGEQIQVDPSIADDVKAKGYVSPEDYKPPVDATPQPPPPAANPNLPAPPPDKTPNISDADLTPDGKLRAFNPDTGEEIHVGISPDAQLTDIQKVRDKGYVLRSDYQLAKSQQAKDEAAAAEKEAKLGIEGFSQSELGEQLAGKNPLVAGLEYGAAETGKDVVSLVEHLIPGVSQGQIKQSLTGATPEQIEAEEKAHKKVTDSSAAGQAAYWLSHISSMLGPMGAYSAGTTGAVKLLATGAELGGGAAAKLATGAAIGAAAEGNYGTLRTLQTLNEVVSRIKEGAQFAGFGGAVAAQYPKAAEYYKVAIEGAGNTTDDVVDKLAKGDKLGAAESLFLGAGSNVAIHGLFSLGARGAEAAELDAAKTAAYLASDAAQKNAQKAVGEMFGIAPEVIAKDGEKLGPLLEKAGVTKEDLFKDGVGKIQKLIEEGEPNVAKAYETLDKASSKTEILQDALYKSEGQIKSMTQDLVGPMKEDAEKSLSKILSQVGSLGEKENLSFSDITKLKQWLENFDEKTPLIVGAKSAIRANIIQAENEALYNFASDASKSGNVAKVAEYLSTEKALYDAKQLFSQAVVPKAAAKTAAERIKAIPSYIKAGLLVHALVHPLTGIPHAALHIAKHTILDAVSGAMKEASGGAGKEAFGRQVAILQGTTTPMKHWIVDAQKALDTKLGQHAKDLFAALSSKGVASHADQINKSINSFLPTNGSGQSRDTQVDILRRAVGTFASNPQMFTNHLNALTAPLRQEGLGQVADAYTDHALRLMKVIQAVLPKDPSMMNAHPFATNVKQEDISPATKAKYERALTIASDPTKLLGLIKSNTITQTDVAIAAATNPSTLQKMRNALVDEALKNKPDLSYQQRLSMDIFMGQNMDESTAPLAVIQGAFAPVVPQGSSGVQNSRNLKPGSASTIADAYKTPSQSTNIVAQR